MTLQRNFLTFIAGLMPWWNYLLWKKTTKHLKQWPGSPSRTWMANQNTTFNRLHTVKTWIFLSAKTKSGFNFKIDAKDSTQWMFDPEKWCNSACFIRGLTKASSEEEGKEDDDVINFIKDIKVFFWCYTFFEVINILKPISPLFSRSWRSLQYGVWKTFQCSLYINGGCPFLTLINCPFMGMRRFSIGRFTCTHLRVHFPSHTNGN